jgi:hypothetical protein
MFIFKIFLKPAFCMLDIMIGLWAHEAEAPVVMLINLKLRNVMNSNIRVLFVTVIHLANAVIILIAKMQEETSGV